MTDGPSDAALVLRARGGDELAFRRLVDRYTPMLQAVVNRYYLKSGDRDDLDQEALLGMHAAVDGYQRRRGNFRAFARLCVERKVITAVKRDSQLRNKGMNEAASLSQPVFGAADTEDTTLGELLADPCAKEPHSILEEHAELVDVVRAVNFRLSDTERVALLGILEGRSYDEISATHDLSAKTIDNAMQRARLKVARFAPSAA